MRKHKNYDKTIVIDIEERCSPRRVATDKRWVRSARAHCLVNYAPVVDAVHEHSVTNVVLKTSRGMCE